MGRELTDRSGTLLRTLVALHIRDGSPVGSQTLREEAGLSVSPATVRNVMSDLEERGFLHSPHTSAGRVPTDQGYRFFVDSLLQVNNDLDSSAFDSLRKELNPDRNTSDLVQTASNMLSSITSQAGVVTVPRPMQQPLRQVEFLPLSGDRVLVILVINQREVQNRIIHTRRVFSDEELRAAAQQINQRFAGQALAEVQSQVDQELLAARSSLDDYLSATLDLAQQALADDANPSDYLIVGESRLLEGASPEELQRLRELFATLESKRDLSHLLERCSEADGVKIFIGEEAGSQMFGDYSLITAPYGDGARTLGVLGVIGPTRMAYDRVIPIVDVTSKMLSAALGH
ncbi:heat-inducible transcriptional repressor HrcA [Congregibacter sp.]|uniref:heat-inducible transcriptional repressor HrcA n=1 Tax=Congregibacter sp. TaxID=2744308 RepID=UPI00385A0F41